jgi:hypothetical protein
MISRIMPDKTDSQPLIAYLTKTPAIVGPIVSGVGDGNLWWVKFAIDIDHPLAWRVVQELGHVLNYMSVNERLPTVFMPVSPPVYLNGGPREYLSWVIESRDEGFKPADCAEWLEGRLPCPVDDPEQWKMDDEG